MPLESNPLPTGYHWKSPPANDRYAAVLCHGAWPRTIVVAYVNSMAEALEAIDHHQALSEQTVMGLA